MKDFKCWLPFSDFSLQKAEDNNTADYFLIKGDASTDGIDLDSEKVLQEGLDFDYFLKHGFFNYNHDNKQNLGEPTVVKAGVPKTINGKQRLVTHVEGILYDLPLVRNMLETQNAMRKAKSKRRLGMSLEGAIIKRDNKDKKVIKKARVTDVALTWKPVNTETEAVIEIAKSLTAKDTQEQGQEIETIDSLKQELSEVKAELDKIKKSMSIGHERPRATGAGVLITDAVSKQEITDFVKKQYPDKSDKDINKLINTIIARLTQQKQEEI